MLKSALFFGLEKSINFILSRDEQSAERLAVLEDKIICLDINDINLKAYWLWIFDDQIWKGVQTIFL